MKTNQTFLKGVLLVLLVFPVLTHADDAIDSSPVKSRFRGQTPEPLGTCTQSNTKELNEARRALQKIKRTPLEEIAVEIGSPLAYIWLTMGCDQLTPETSGVNYEHELARCNHFKGKIADEEETKLAYQQKVKTQQHLVSELEKSTPVCTIAISFDDDDEDLGFGAPPQRVDE